MLNTEHFVLLAGDPRAWDDEIKRKCRPGNRDGTFESEDLCALQERQARAGREGARLHQTIYGWSVRDDSGMSGWAILYSGRYGDGSIEAAIAFGVAWVAKDPAKREFYAYREDVEAWFATHGIPVSTGIAEQVEIARERVPLALRERSK